MLYHSVASRCVPTPSRPIPSHPSHPISSDLVLPHHILSHPIPCRPIPSCSMSTCSIPPHLCTPTPHPTHHIACRPVPSYQGGTSKGRPEGQMGLHWRCSSCGRYSSQRGRSNLARVPRCGCSKDGGSLRPGEICAHSFTLHLDCT